MGRNDGAVFRRPRGCEHRSRARCSSWDASPSRAAAPELTARMRFGGVLALAVAIAVVGVAAQSGGKPVKGNPTPGTPQPDPPKPRRPDHADRLRPGGARAGARPRSRRTRQAILASSSRAPSAGDVTPPEPAAPPSPEARGPGLSPRSDRKPALGVCRHEGRNFGRGEAAARGIARPGKRHEYPDHPGRVRPEDRRVVFLAPHSVSCIRFHTISGGMVTPRTR